MIRNRFATLLGLSARRARLLGLPVFAAALLGVVLWPRSSPAFVILGGPLSLDLRAVRVFNNFTDPEANANQVPDRNFPGYTGAELAIWKAAVEWGSTLHGDGFGDPTQPGGLGSGGANFDFAWQGRAPDIGGPDDNVVSQINGASLGVLAFTELPADDGWRIRFRNAPWTWHDDPAASFQQSGGAADIQAIATHEFGHALGLDHSADPNATMSGTIPFPNRPLRSIEADDIEGLKFLYGERDPQKPLIRSYRVLENGSVELLGAHFDPSDNEVWFTPQGITTVGIPVSVRGLPSTHGGRRLIVSVPDEAGPGDILVRRPGDGFAELSNAFPFDPAVPPCLNPSSYGSGKLTSAGSVATLLAGGSNAFENQSLQFTLFGLPAGTDGILLIGQSPQNVPFKGGSLLVAPPIQRGPRFTTDFIGFSTFEFPFGADLVNQTRFFQAWFLDDGDPFGVGTSNGVRVPFCPGS